MRSSSELVVWYFWAFCKVGIIKEALRKARFYYMEIYLLLGLSGNIISSLPEDNKGLNDDYKGYKEVATQEYFDKF